MKRISDYTLMVEQEICSLTFPEDVASLYDPIAYALESGGKRLRPVLTLMACEGCGGDPRMALKAAVGVEMFHNFTLLHDDVMDNSSLRRGRPTVCRKWNDNTAILSGDTMLTLATELVMNVPDNALRGVLDTFNRMAIDVYEGQQLDMDFENERDVALDRYIRMITGKTSALLGGAAKIGALIAGKTADEAEALYEFGLQLGLAFQIQDDYLDLYGDPDTFGKPIGGDILNEKKTFLLISALGMDGAAREALGQALELPDGELKIKTVRNLFTSMGIPELCRKAIDSYSAAAIGALSGAGMSEEGRESMVRLVGKLISRDR